METPTPIHHPAPPNPVISGSGISGSGESRDSAVNWAAILAGAAVAAGFTLALLPLGSVLGFASDAVWNLGSEDAVVITAAAAGWLIVMQWLSSFAGGYVAGRMRTRWTHVRDDEIFFRDTAHGLLSWCIATFAVIFIVGAAGAIASETVAEATQSVANDAGNDTETTGMAFSAALSISMFIGALIASVSAIMGGKQRDAY